MSGCGLTRLQLGVAAFGDLASADSLILDVEAASHGSK
jgi:hypothetical protein